MRQSIRLLRVSQKTAYASAYTTACVNAYAPAQHPHTLPHTHLMRCRIRSAYAPQTLRIRAAYTLRIRSAYTRAYTSAYATYAASDRLLSSLIRCLICSLAPHVRQTIRLVRASKQGNLSKDYLREVDKALQAMRVLVWVWCQVYAAVYEVVCGRVSGCMRSYSVAYEVVCGSI